MRLVIAGVEVAPPSELEFGEFDLVKAKRTASGRMTMEVIRAGVRRIDVTWRYLPDPALRTILDVLRANKPFFTVQYEDGDSMGSMTAYAGDIRRIPGHKLHGVRYWKEVQVPLIEQ